MDDSSSTVSSHPGYYLQGFYTSQVVQDFFHQQYVETSLIPNFRKIDIDDT